MYDQTKKRTKTHLGETKKLLLFHIGDNGGYVESNDTQKAAGHLVSIMTIVAKEVKKSDTLYIN